MTRKIYLDYAASTPVDVRVFRAMAPYFRDRFGNAGSLHSFGQEAIAGIDAARETVLRTLGIGPEGFRSFIFTGSATEANNLALCGVMGIGEGTRVQGMGYRGWSTGVRGKGLGYREQGAGDRGDEKPIHPRPSTLDPQPYPLNPRIILSPIEHESVLETARDLEAQGADVVFLPMDRSGRVDASALEDLLDDRTLLVSVMTVNNEIGTVQPIAEIAKMIRNFRDSLSPKPYSLYPFFHTDAVQAFGYYDVSPGVSGADLITLSAHKIGGPKGVGGLYHGVGYRGQGIGDRGDERFIHPRPSTLDPIITGGGQEFGLRSGTENVPGIVGFGVAAELAASARKKESARILLLKQFLWSGLRTLYPKAKINGPTNFSPHRSSPHILNIFFPGVLSETLLIALDRAGVAVSSGSACSARSPHPSHVLLALGFDEARARSSIRFSFGRETTRAELQRTIQIVSRILRGNS